MTETYDFGYDFQVAILRVMLRKQNFVRSYRGCLDPDFFDSDELRYLSEAVLQYQQDFGEVPTRTTFEHLAKQITLPKSLRSVVDDIVESVWTEPAEDYVAQQAVNFAQRCALRIAVSDTIDDLDHPDRYPLARERFELALQVGVDEDDLGYDYFANAEQRTNNAGNEKAKRVPTSSPELTEKIGGGPAPGELYIVLAPPSTGKTSFLVDTGAYTVLTGKRVAYFSGEQKQVPIAYRFDGRFTGFTKNDRLKNPQKFLTRLETVRERTGDYLRLNHFLEGTWTADDMGTRVKRMQDAGFEPDIILCDYAKLFKPSRQRSGDIWVEHHQKVLDTRRVLQELDLPGWSGWQAGKESLYATWVTMKSAADSFKMTNDADGIVTICQTRKESQNRRARFYVAKAREEARDTYCCVRTDYALCRFEPDDDPLVGGDNDD